MNVLLAHGGSSEAHAEDAHRLARRVAESLGAPVVAGFLDEAPAHDVTCVLPLFLAEGRHVRRDAPAWAARAGARLIAGPCDTPEIVAPWAAALAERTRQAHRSGARPAGAVAFALHRLRDARALMAALYPESKRFPWPAVVGLHGECRLQDVLALWREEGVREAVVQPVLMFEGRTLTRLREIAASADGLDVQIGRPLSDHPELADWLAERFRRVRPD
ncbi:MAG: CbiX/SirB N-terminal domain-containing protein [Mariprofundaceae bacterium]